MTKDTQAQRAPTVSHVLGEMTWLLTQSPLHRALAIGDLEWLVMPALLREQFYIFRDGEQPVGLALWAKTDAVGERKLAGGLIDPGNRLTLEEWSAGDRVWLVDLIAPFADENNRHLEVMMADLISGPLRGQEFRFHRVDPKTGAREVKIVPAAAGEDLRQALEKVAVELAR
ncbi:ACP:hemolysin acyltransferase (hemolysin-activating protein) [Caulobacter sp. AP07]|uniref:toxin-activating lysine-acyltransferase n=1 Tax=Caulobacter sp. AP07 TaxID=1144304 RepID=UPI00027216AE|nr:toxin-activating lysine-acyltransferase [Caulobacter sp. AP07]EJL21730.1 ACP:hemolysin acyltransferase (hemolysin-activating protein) [Caulobacter sp. AP07]